MKTCLGKEKILPQCGLRITHQYVLASVEHCGAERSRRYCKEATSTHTQSIIIMLGPKYRSMLGPAGDLQQGQLDPFGGGWRDVRRALVGKLGWKFKNTMWERDLLHSSSLLMK